MTTPRRPTNDGTFTVGRVGSLSTMYGREQALRILREQSSTTRTREGVARRQKGRRFRGPSPSMVLFDEVTPSPAVDDAISRYVQATMTQRVEQIEAMLRAALLETKFDRWHRIHVVDQDGHSPAVACGLTPLDRYPLSPTVSTGKPS